MNRHKRKLLFSRRGYKTQFLPPSVNDADVDTKLARNSSDGLTGFIGSQHNPAPERVIIGTTPFANNFNNRLRGARCCRSECRCNSISLF